MLLTYITLLSLKLFQYQADNLDNFYVITIKLVLMKIYNEIIDPIIA